MKRSEILVLRRPKGSKKWGGVKKLKEMKRKKIKAFLLCSTGMDWFPFQEAQDMGFIVKNTYYESEKSVAPFAFKLLDDLNRKVYGDYPIEYFGKTALILGGRGRIGSMVFKIAEAYGMKPIDYDIGFMDEVRGRKLLREKWLPKAKIIFVCCPQTKENTPFFSKGEYNLMTENPLIINVVGILGLFPLITLAQFIKKGVISGYACDDVPRNKFKNHDSMVFTDHVAWKTGECWERRIDVEEKALNELLSLDS